MRRRRWIALGLGLIVLSGLALLLSRQWFSTSVVLPGHTAAVTGVAFAPDGRTLASASLDDTIRLWRLTDHTLLRTIPADIGGLNSVAFTPDGQMVAAGGVDDTARLWRVADGAPVRIFSGATSQVQGIAVTPDGQGLAAASADGKIRLWRVADGTLVWVADAGIGRLKGLAMAPDGHTLAATGENDATGLWAVPDGRLVYMLRGWPGQGATYGPASRPTLSNVAYSPDSALVASSAYGYSSGLLRAPIGRIDLWRVADGQPAGLIPWPGSLWDRVLGHPGVITTIAFAADGRTLATNLDEEIRLWNLTNMTSFQILSGHDGPVTSLAFAPDGRTLASGSQDMTVRLWRTAPLPPPTPTPTPVGLLRVLGGSQQSASRVAFVLDGQTVASGGGDTVRLWRWSDGQLLRAFDIPGGWGMAVAPDGRTLAAPYSDTVGLWDLAAGHLLHTFPAPSVGNQGHVSFSADGRFLLAAALDGQVRLGRIADGTALPGLDNGAVTQAAALSPDGQLLAVEGPNHTIQLWRSADDRVLAVLPGHTGYIVSLAFSPDGQMLASASRNEQTVRVWRVADGHLVRTLTGPTGFVLTVAYSPDGQVLASGGEDRTVHLWRAADGAALGVLRGPLGPIVSLAFAPDGRTLAAAAGDNAGWVWTIGPPMSSSPRPPTRTP
jgi:WD40 repeat protein